MLGKLNSLATPEATAPKAEKVVVTPASNLARLNIPNPDSVDQRWFIRFRVWSEKNKKFILRKDYSVNLEKDLEKRKKLAEIKIREINRLLKLGMVADEGDTDDKDTLDKKYEIDEISVFECLKQCLKIKEAKKLRQITSLYKYAKVFILWLEETNRKNYNASKLSYDTVYNFVNYLTVNRKVNSRTANNYINALISIFNEAVELKLISANPFKKIKKFPVGIGRNHAFNAEQKSLILNHIKSRVERAKSYEGMWLFCQFIYYTLARTNEISSLKPEYIGLHRPDQIYLPADVSKNQVERHITIPPQLADLIERYNLKSIKKGLYIFSYRFEPGPVKVNSQYFGHAFRQRVLDPLGFTKDYTLYSWKHTGVCDLYRNGLTKSAIQLQLGHRGTEAFDVYLKSLGLFENEEIKNSFPDIIQENNI